jgi:Ca2+-binding RTX toxin-like protein
MSRFRGAAVIAACAAALVAAPAAQGAQGSDSLTRWDYIDYRADPGETNDFTAESVPGALHLNDSGAIIRWATAPIPGESECTAGGHDVVCVDEAGFEIGASLGDGNDSLVDKAKATVLADLGPGDDRAVGGGQGYSLDGGPGADDLHGGPVNRALIGGPAPQRVTYAKSPGAVTVTPDDVANDGMVGEHDNVHSDVYEVEGSAFDDRISGFESEDGGAGDDTLTGSSGPGLIYGGDGNDTIDARDGQADQISCGAGQDTAFVDAQDVLVGSDCEDVRVG